MDARKHKVSCAVASLMVVPALVASVLLPFSDGQGTAYAATPAKVTSVKASSVTKSGFKVTWKKASSKKVKGYQLKVYKGKSLKKTYVAKGRSVTSRSVSGLSANTKYTVKVRAYTGSSKKKYGKWSASKSVTTKKSQASGAKPSSKPSNTVSNAKYVDMWGCEYVVTKTEVVPSSWNKGKLLVVHYRFTNKAKTDQYSSFSDLNAYQHGVRLDGTYELGSNAVHVISGGSVEGFECYELNDDSDVLLRVADYRGDVKFQITVKGK